MACRPEPPVLLVPLALLAFAGPICRNTVYE